MVNYDAKTEDGRCIFCAIVAGERQSYGKFWEDDEFFAFLAIDPNTPGFSCVIPKKHYGSDVLKMPDDVLQKFIIAAKKVAAILERHYDDVGRVGFMAEGTGVDHAHIKLSPFHGTENLKKGIWEQMPSGKEFWFEKYEGWFPSAGGPRMDPEKIMSLAEELRAAQKGSN